MNQLAAYAASAILLCAVFSPAIAQDARLKPGTMIRFRAGMSDTLHVGQLARATPDSLILRHCSTCHRLGYTLAEVDQLAVARVTNRGDRTIAGLGIGALVGAGLGYLSAQTCHGADRCDLAALAVPFGGIAGAIIGAGVGFITAYKWEVIPRVSGT